MNEQENWYIEYDFKTFSILQQPNFDTLIYRVAQMLGNVVGPSQIDDSDSQKIPEWIGTVAEAFTQISILLYNFFYVEEKLTSNREVKKLFSKIYTVLRIENQYSRYFFTKSKNFRINRILALCLRLNQFIEAIFIGIEDIRKSLDQTLLDNLNEVYLFMEQKIQETLEMTKEQQDHDLNIIMLDMLSLLLRNSGDPTMKKILDRKKKKLMLDAIQKDNEIYEEFQLKKIEELRNFEVHQYIEVQQEMEEDPNIMKEEESDSSF